MTPRLITLIFLGLAATRTMAVAADDGAVHPNGIEFFEKRVRPLLVEHCAECHSAAAGKIKGGLDLDSRLGWEKGGEAGPAIVPGHPDESLLITAVRRLDKDLAMPPKKELPAGMVNDLVTWVKMGAPDPRTASSGESAEAKPAPAFDLQEARTRWAYHAPALPPVPRVNQPGWAVNDVDLFLLAAMEGRGVKPTASVDPRTLARRLSYDLTGLPLAPAEIEAFVQAAGKDRSRAVREMVERLLQSPHYGEKWGRHWLDVVRYADSLDARGQGKEGDILDAWRYRDWVVQAFNRDLPYDEFIRQQVAGDLLADQGPWEAGKVIATGMYAIGNWGNGDSDKQKVYTDIVDDQVDVTSRAFMGLTLACARCHDHKFDPLSTADYYGMAGFFFSSHILKKFADPTAGEKIMRIRLLPPEQLAARDTAEKQLAEVEATMARGLVPFDVMETPVSGVNLVFSWTRKGASNPSLLINRSGKEARFSTLSLPAATVSVHPGPRSGVTVAWRAPSDLKVSVKAEMADADAHCGDGIAWTVRSGGQEIGRGSLANGKTDAFYKDEVTVSKGSLLALSILPKAEYTCDTTVVRFQITAADGKSWHLEQALIEGAAKAQEEGWLVCEGEGSQLATERTQDESLVQQRAALRAQLGAETPMAHGLQEGGIPGTKYEGYHDAKIHVRGSYARLGATQARGFPAVLNLTPPPEMKGSGRLALANWLASPEHPLTARVMMNRLWQHHFGHGIVRTPNNFGKLGDPPTHPELLDWLAHQFTASGWSMKAMHRLICNSAAYQQSCEASEETRAADPDNRLFSRQTRRKLTAEELRDAMLSATGQLDATVGGASVNDLQSKRRTIYLTAVRSDRSSFRMLFDGADPNTIVESRNDSIVAPQALWLLNHPFAIAQADALTKRLLQETPDDADTRVRWLYRRLYDREPEAREVEAATALVAAGSWEMLCHALMCSNDFLFVD